MFRHVVTLGVALLVAAPSVAWARQADHESPALDWLAGRWRVSYVDAALGPIEGTACVLPGTAPSDDLAPGAIRVRLQDPQTFDVTFLHASRLAIEGDELVLELGGRSPSAVRRAVTPPLFSKLRREAPRRDLSNVLRAPLGEAIVLRFGETAQPVTTAPGVRKPVSAAVTLRMRISADRRALEGQWNTPFDSRDGMGGRRAGTRDGDAVWGGETWHKDHDPIDGAKVELLDYRSNRARGEHDDSAKLRAQRYPDRTNGTVSLRVPLPPPGRIPSARSLDERVLVESAQPIDDGNATYVTALLDEEILPGKRLLVVDDVPVTWELVLPDTPLETGPEVERSRRLVEHRHGRRRAPDATFSRLMYDGTPPPPVKWQATRTAGVGELFDVSLVLPDEPFYRFRRVELRTPHGTYGPFLAERSVEAPNVLRLPVFFHAGLLEPNAGALPANIVDIDVRPGEEVVVRPADTPSDVAHLLGRLEILPVAEPTWNDALQRAADSIDGVEFDDAAAEWRAVSGALGARSGTGTSVGRKTNWIFTEKLFFLIERPEYLLFPAFAIPDPESPPEISRHLPVTLADHAGLILVRAELLRALRVTDTRIAGIQARLRARSDLGAQTVVEAFPAATYGLDRPVDRADALALLSEFRASLASAIEDVAQVESDDLEELLRVCGLASREILQGAANRLVRPTVPSAGEPLVPSVVPDRLARSIVLSLDTLCDAARKQEAYADADTSVCLALLSSATGTVSLAGKGIAFVGEVAVAGETLVSLGTVAARLGYAIEFGGGCTDLLVGVGGLINDGANVVQLSSAADLEFGLGLATGDFDRYWAHRRARTLTLITAVPSFIGAVSQAVGIRETLGKIADPIAPGSVPRAVAAAPGWVADRLARFRGASSSAARTTESVRTAARTLDSVDPALAEAARKLAARVERELAEASDVADRLRVLEDAERVLHDQWRLVEELESLADELTLRGAEGRDLAARRALLARRDASSAQVYVEWLADHLNVARTSTPEPPASAPFDAVRERVVAVSLEELAAAAGDESLAARARIQSEFHAQKADLDDPAIPDGLDPFTEREVAAWLRAVAPLLDSPEETRYALESARWIEQRSALAFVGVDAAPNVADLPGVLARRASGAATELGELREHLGVRSAELQQGWTDVDELVRAARDRGNTTATGLQQVEGDLSRLRLELEKLQEQIATVSPAAADELRRAAASLAVDVDATTAARAGAVASPLDGLRMRGLRNDLDLPPRVPGRAVDVVPPAERTPRPWIANEPPGVRRGDVLAPRQAVPPTETVRLQLESSAVALADASPTADQVGGVLLSQTLDDLAHEKRALAVATAASDVPRPATAPFLRERHAGSYFAWWPDTSRGRPVVIFEDLGHRVDVSDVYRQGLEPARCGGGMIAAALEGAGVFAPPRIRITNIVPDQPTIGELLNGVPVQHTALGKALDNAVRALGATPSRWTAGDLSDRAWIQVDLVY